MFTETKVVSSQLESIAHDPASNKLRIKLHPTRGAATGSTYEYENFTPEDYAKFLAAESKGSFLINVIKKNVQRWPYTKIA